MSKYSILLNILDKIRNEAPEHLSFYNPQLENEEKLNQARARAYIHLFLKVHTGISDFEEREKFVTDGTNDAGIDGFFINTDRKLISFIQSKFRITEKNFENQKIKLDEILMMEIDRILAGESGYEDGQKYNGKILEMQRQIQKITDIFNYDYEVILLANLSSMSQTRLQKLTSNIPVVIYNYEKAFSDLVFPIVSGTFYNNNELVISVNLSNKNIDKDIVHKIETKLGECEMRMIFVPLLEIGKMMAKYKNSILKFNPRSYITLKEGSINSEIYKSVLNGDTNEFALLNNGITIIADSAKFSTQTFVKDKGYLQLTNPQIVNGGQTAYTLSLIYEESNEKSFEQNKLNGKEVLLKLISMPNKGVISKASKLSFIESISEASNKQNPIDNADRSSNNSLLIQSQKALFDNFGFLLERKRGEFYDGLRYGYITQSQIIDRAIFLRIAFAALNYPVPPQKNKSLFTESKIDLVLNDSANFKKYFFGCLLYSALENLNPKLINATSYKSAYFAMISIAVEKYYKPDLQQEVYKDLAEKAIRELIMTWPYFEKYFMEKFNNSQFFTYAFTYINNSYKMSSRIPNYFKSQNLSLDLNDYFFNGSCIMVEDIKIRNKEMTLEKHLANNNLTLEIIFEVKPYIDKDNWYDKESIKATSQATGISEYTVKAAIRQITSRDIGFYISNNFGSFD